MWPYGTYSVIPPADGDCDEYQCTRDANYDRNAILVLTIITYNRVEIHACKVLSERWQGAYHITAGGNAGMGHLLFMPCYFM